jgi:ribonuclease VapC
VIVVDASAIVAILLDEPEAEEFMRMLLEAEETVISAATWFEAAMVWEGRQKNAAQSALFDELIDELGLAIVPLASEHARIAREAFRRYGKGRGRGQAGKHAKLNFGDCFSYALAKALDAPLLFKGGDFALTDVKQA